MDSNLELLEKYYRNELQGQQLEHFQQRLETDRELVAEMEAYHQTMAVIAVASEQRLKKRFNAIASQKFTDVRLKPMVGLRIIPIQLAVAASILIFIALGYWAYWYLNQKTDTANLYAQYFEIPSIDQVTVRGTITDKTWLIALESYEQEDFRSAAMNFEHLLSDPSFAQPSAANLYLGICYLMMDKDKEAVNRFNLISKQSAFEQQAEWYKALTFLKQRNIDQAIQQLHIIAARRDHYKNNEAIKILKNIES